MTAPPLKPPFERVSDPAVMSSTPTTIIAKAMKNSQLSRERDEITCGRVTGGLDLAAHSEQDHRGGSKQLLQTVRAHD